MMIFSQYGQTSEVEKAKLTIKGEILAADAFYNYLCCNFKHIPFKGLGSISFILNKYCSY